MDQTLQSLICMAFQFLLIKRWSEAELFTIFENFTTSLIKRWSEAELFTIFGKFTTSLIKLL